MEEELVGHAKAHQRDTDVGENPAGVAHDLKHGGEFVL